MRVIESLLIDGQWSAGTHERQADVFLALQPHGGGERAHREQPGVAPLDVDPQRHDRRQKPHQQDGITQTE